LAAFFYFEFLSAFVSLLVCVCEEKRKEKRKNEVVFQLSGKKEKKSFISSDK
jgi:hypothetical protein